MSAAMRFTVRTSLTWRWMISTTRSRSTTASSSRAKSYIYAHGVLNPSGELNLREDQRVRVIVEPLDEQPEDRPAALARLKAGIASMQFFSDGRLPSRGDVHDRP
jgi:predicted DNA-binding antitoxin AbrB/MazE fold protein